MTLKVKKATVARKPELSAIVSPAKPVGTMKLTTDTKVLVHRRVGMAKDALSPRERILIENSIRSIQKSPTIDESIRVRKLANHSSLRLYGVSPSLSLVFRKSPGSVEILDIVQPETLKWYARSNQESEKSGRRRHAKKID